MSVLSTAPTDNAAQAELDTTLLHLPNQQHPFELQQHYCNNPDCHCNEALLTLTETAPQGQPLSYHKITVAEGVRTVGELEVMQEKSDEIKTIYFSDGGKLYVDQ